MEDPAATGGSRAERACRVRREMSRLGSEQRDRDCNRVEVPGLAGRARTFSRTVRPDEPCLRFKGPHDASKRRSEGDRVSEEWFRGDICCFKDSKEEVFFCALRACEADAQMSNAPCGHESLKREIHKTTIALGALGQQPGVFSSLLTSPTSPARCLPPLYGT